MNYTAYGLTIKSQIALPELLLLKGNLGGAGPDVSIRIGKVDESGLQEGKQLGPFLWINRNALWLHVTGVARFLIKDGNEIVIDPEPGIDEDSIRLFLLGSAFGALLFQHGYLVLHGNAIRIGEECLICVGDSGAGKSTTAAGFMQRGYSILSDDVVPVDHTLCALPGFPRIKLWKNTADQLKIDTQDLRRIRPEMDKFNYPLLDRFVEQPLPIRWIYILGSHPKPDIHFEVVRGMERFQPLYDNTYRAGFMEGMALKEEHLSLCGRLAGQIRLARIIRPENGFELDQLIDRILLDISENS